MALEDLSMFRAVHGSYVFYPSDAVSMERAVELAANTNGICFIRSSRPATPVIYKNDEEFAIGKAKVSGYCMRSNIEIVVQGVHAESHCRTPSRLHHYSLPLWCSHTQSYPHTLIAHSHTLTLSLTCTSTQYLEHSYAQLRTLSHAFTLPPPPHTFSVTVSHSLSVTFVLLHTYSHTPTPRNHICRRSQLLWNSDNYKPSLQARKINE